MRQTRAPFPGGPNFLIIGAAKAATTSLVSLLEQHPEAGIALGKEPHFFSFDRHYARGWESYRQLFLHCGGKAAAGDASTSYSRLRYYPRTIERIQRHLGMPKIIYMVRHPLHRIESAFAEHLRTPGAPRAASINEAILRQPMIVDSSRYWETFDAYRKAFGEANIKVVWFEQYSADPIAAFKEVCGFLGIDLRFTPDLSRESRNARGPARADCAWDPELKRAVLRALREDNLRLLRHFGKPESHWGGIFTA